MAYELLTALVRQLGDHLWQSTLFAAGIGILAQTLRANHASVRYRLWLAASLKFLAPFSLLSAVGWRLGSRLAPAVPTSRISFVLDEIAAPLAPLGHVVPAPPTATSYFTIYALASVFAVWAVGCGVVLFRSWCRWWRVRTIVRHAAPLETGRVNALWNHPATSALGIDVLSSQTALEPGVFGIFRPVLYLPSQVADKLSQQELKAILAHELCHVRRRDNLTAALHVMVESVFWFHPLVWWLGARLIEERERACDEAVLQAGIEPGVYAESILQVCRQCLKSPSVCVAGVTGSSLRKRIEEIMTNRIVTRLSSRRKLLLTGAALMAVIGPVVAGMVSGSRLHAQPSTLSIVAAPSGAKFEVASIKPVALTNGPPPANSGIRIDAARVDIGYWSVYQLILRAYGLPAYQVSVPSWTHNSRFDVVAKFPEGTTPDQLPQMLQWLLADRFGLVAHVETRELPGFALVVGKGGPKMKPADPDPDAPSEPVPANRLERAGRTLDRLWSNDAKDFGASIDFAGNVMHVAFKRMPMEALAQIAADRLGAPAIDMTGLQGDYQLALDLVSPGASLPEPVGELSAPDPAGAMLAAVQRLGLKLEPRKTSIQVLVVDSINRVPAEN